MEGNTQQQTALDMRPGSRGRRDQSGIEGPVKVKPLKDGVKELMKLYMRIESAKTKYKEALKTCAGAGNVSASTLGKLIRVSANGKFKDTVHAVEQEQEVFEAVGEVPGGKDSESGE